MATGFDTGAALPETPTFLERKRKALEDEMPVEDECLKRQKSWSQRMAPGSCPSSWRPKQTHRVSAKNFLAYIDNQLRQSTPLPGLVFHQKNDSLDAWKDWRTWPHLRINFDLGSEQLTGVHALERLFELNVSGLADFDHGAQRSTLEVLKGTHLHDFWLLMTVSWNLLDGPDQNAYRLHQIRASNQDILERTSPRTNLVFMELCPRIAKELKDAGVELPGEQDSDFEIWQYWANFQANRAKLSRTSTNRFQALLDRAKHALTGTWSIDYFERLHLALELDMLKGKKFAERMTVRASSVAGSSKESDGQREPTKIAQIEDKTLKGVCQNAVGISIAMLSDYTHKRVVESVFYSLDHIRRWRSDMARRCKSADECLDFLVEMATTGLGAHIGEGLDVLTNKATLDLMSFTLTVTEGDLNSLLPEDEEFAALTFSLVTAGAKARCVRLLELQSWPKHMVGTLKGEAQATTILNLFKEDHDIFKELSAMPDRTKRLNAVHKRHLFHLTPNKQYIAACEEVGYGPNLHEDLRAVVTNNNKGLCSTNLVEEVVGTVKNYKEVKSSSKFRSPAVSFGRVLASKVVEKRTRFDAVQEMAGQPRPLPPDAFKGNETDWSLPFAKVQGNSQIAPFYSPSAKNRNVPGADLHMLRDAKKAGDFGLVEHAWLGKMFTSEHAFAYEHLGPTGQKQWIFPLHSFPDSSTVVLPLELHAVPGTNLQYFDVQRTSEPTFISVFKIANQTTARAAMVEVHSPYWHALSASPTVRNLPPAIRLFKVGSFKPLAKIAAEKAFWLMPRNDVADFSAYFGHPVVGATNLFETLMAAVQGILGCTADEALDFVHVRLASMASLTHHSKELDPKTD